MMKSIRMMMRKRSPRKFRKKEEVLSFQGQRLAFKVKMRWLDWT